MEVFPTSFARPVPFSIDVITPVEISMVLHPHDWRTLCFCSWSGKSEVPRARRDVCPLCGCECCRVLELGCRKHPGLFLCAVLRSHTGHRVHIWSEAADPSLPSPSAWWVRALQPSVSRFRGTTSTVEPHLHSVQQIIWHEIPGRQLLAPALTEVWEWVSSWEFIHI